MNYHIHSLSFSTAFFFFAIFTPLLVRMDTKHNLKERPPTDTKAPVSESLQKRK